MKFNSYQTERLFLKPTDQSDAPFLLELMNSSKWIKYIGDRKVKTNADAEDYIRIKMDPQLERLGFGNFTMILKTNGTRIGSCGLYDREGLEGLDIGFALLESYEKQGYAFEGSKLILDLGLNDFGYNKISAITTLENVSSQNLLNKLGLSFTKMIRIPNDDEELMLFEIEKI